MCKKTLETSLDGVLRLEEETLTDGSKVHNVRICGDYTLAAEDYEQAASVFLLVGKMMRP